jgi:[ribosomal protein S5]-alanine N-acetyltransferase
MASPTLETARLLLRPFEQSDAPEVRRLAGDPAVADTTLNIPHPYPEGVAETWIAAHPQIFADGSGANWAVVARAGEMLLGSISIGIAASHSRAEMGYWLGRAYWGLGHTTEAAAAVLHYCFAERGLHRVLAHHFSRNPASGRVMQKIGMRHEGTLRGHMRKGEGWEDLEVYGILRHEWEHATGTVPPVAVPRT